MSIVRPEDLFDHERYTQILRELEGATDSFATSTVSAVERIRKAYDTSQQNAALLRAEVDRVNVTQVNASKVLRDYATQSDKTTQELQQQRQTLTLLTEARKLNNQFVDQATKRLNELQSQYENLDKSGKDYERQQRAILRETKTLTSAIDAQGKALKAGKNSADAAEGSFQHLKNQVRDLKATLDQMPSAYDAQTGAINRQNRAAVALNEQYQKSIALIKRIESGQQIHSRNVGNYPQPTPTPSLNLASGIGAKSIGLLAGLAGLDSLQASLEKINDVTVQLDSLDSALKVVTDDTDLFIKRQTMLKQVSDDLGQDIGLLEKQYTSLTAASKDTNLEGAATDKIFTAVVGTMGRLKKPTETTERALMAIEQIMAKGTVKAEELTGQLSETGISFNIAARAMGVTTRQLTDMLQKGEVMASDFLPKLAAELERTFNPHHEQRVEGLAANMARLRNEGVEWVRSLNMGQSLGDFIGWLTRTGRAIREEFSSPLERSGRLLAEQKEKVNQLESALPGLLSRYDELKSKASLSVKEQGELRTVINDITALAPSAATGFDQYGNALDINKGKVLSFVEAQRKLNDELSKQVNDDLNKQIQGNSQVLQSNQTILNRGTKQKSFANPKWWLFMSNDERKQATDKDAGKRREVPLEDSDITALQSDSKKRTDQIIADSRKLLANNGQLDKTARSLLEKTGEYGDKQLLKLSDLNQKIEEKRNKTRELFNKGLFDQRAVMLKDIEQLEGERNGLLNPLSGKPSAAPAEIKTLSESAQNKAQREADKRTRDAVALSKANSEKTLKQLENDRQDGLIGEQVYIERQLQLTRDGVEGRMAILKRAGKTQTKEYADLQGELLEANTKYSRSQLKLDLNTAKSLSEIRLKELEKQKAEGTISEQEFVEQRHQIATDGFEAERRVLEENGKLQTELGQNLHSRQLDEQADYHEDRIKAERKSWKEQLESVKDGLSEINKEIASNLDTQLKGIERDYVKRISDVEVGVKTRKINPEEGRQEINRLRLRQIDEELAAITAAYEKEKTLGNKITDEKIAFLNRYKDEAIRTPAETEAAKKAIADLEAARDKKNAQDKIDLDNKVADNALDRDQEVAKQRGDNADVALAKFKFILDKSFEFTSLIGEGIISIEKARLDKQSADLSAQKERELNLVGDNADARARIEEEFDKKQAAIRRRQAIADRNAALFRIALATAQGIAAVFSTGGGTYYADLGISAGILAGIVIAQGALQAAAVMAATPAYKDGKRASDPYTGKALAGEAGAELFIDREGFAQLLTKPTIIDTKAGDTIFPASVTTQILRQYEGSEGLRNSRMYDEAVTKGWEGQVEREILILQRASEGRQLTKNDIRDGVAEALDSRPSEVTRIDEDGFNTYTERGRNRTHYLNNRNSFK